MITKTLRILIILGVCFLPLQFLFSQSYDVKRTSFSSRINNEFSPSYYQDGITFCSDRADNSLIGYQDEQKGLFKIFFVKKTNSGWKQPGFLANELTSDVNDGPITFNGAGNRAYFSRNNSTGNKLGNLIDTTNKLGIYSAELINGKWCQIKPFIFNRLQYNYSTPALSPDDNRIFFSSDMPGGYGGMDLYYCEKSSEGWKEPVNMGPFINTPLSESFPFASKDGKLFFASNGHKGLGGKDIYYTQEINGTWITPVHLDSAINSFADDFGFITDSSFEQGYFSSNRMKTDDIFSFSLLPAEFTHCDTIQENNYCFTFYDERQQLIDTVAATYSWDFGNGIIRIGKEVKYCFPGAGNYIVKLTITDDIAGKPIADNVEYQVDLKDIEQALINSDNIGLVNQPMSFLGIPAFLTNFKVKEYLWNFGDGFKTGGNLASKTFLTQGEYTVKLGLWGEKDSLGIIPEKCYMKNVFLFNSYEELITAEQPDGPMQVKIFLMDDLSENQKTVIKESVRQVSSSLIENIAELLKTNPGIRLESVFLVEDDTLNIANKLAQELAFYFRNQQLGKDTFHCTTGKAERSVFKSNASEGKSKEGTVQFIFMKNKIQRLD